MPPDPPKSVSRLRRSKIPPTFKRLVPPLFSDELIVDIVCNAEGIFTLKDLLYTSPVFSNNHAKFILDIFQDIFQDIECATCDNIIDSDMVDSIDEMELLDDVFTETDYFKDYFDNTDSDDEDPDLLTPDGS
jgi:hypothetical protein